MDVFLCWWDCDLKVGLRAADAQLLAPLPHGGALLPSENRDVVPSMDSYFLQPATNAMLSDLVSLTVNLQPFGTGFTLPLQEILFIKIIQVPLSWPWVLLCSHLISSTSWEYSLSIIAFSPHSASCGQEETDPSPVT